MLNELASDERKVLHAVSSLRIPTRLAILQATGLSNGRTTRALQSMREKGIIVSHEETRQEKGRPSIIHEIAPGAFFAIGAALTVGCCTIAAVSGTGELLESHQLTIDARAFDEAGLRALLERVGNDVTEAIGRRDPTRCIAVGLSVLGRVDTDRGVWSSGLQYGPFRNFDVGSALHNVGVPVMVEDHARSMAFLERRRSAAPQRQDFAVLYMGEGLGSAFVLNGEIYRGHHGVAGEIGHIALSGNERRCICGDTGCLETVASGSGIVATAKARMAEGVISILTPRGDPSETLTLDAIHEAAKANDRLARQVLQEAGEALGEAGSILMKMLNVPRIVVCGEGSLLADCLREPMTRRIRERAPLESQRDFQIDFALYSPSDEPIGVAMLAIDGAMASAAGTAEGE